MRRPHPGRADGKVRVGPISPLASTRRARGLTHFGAPAAVRARPQQLSFAKPLPAPATAGSFAFTQAASCTVYG